MRESYLWLIWLTIGGMFLHNLLDLRRKVLNPLPRPMVPVARSGDRAWAPASGSPTPCC